MGESFVGTWGIWISLISVRMGCAYLGDGMAFGGHFALGVEVNSEEGESEEDAKRCTCGTNKRPPSTEGTNSKSRTLENGQMENVQDRVRIEGCLEKGNRTHGSRKRDWKVGEGAGKAEVSFIICWNWDRSVTGLIRRSRVLWEEDRDLMQLQVEEVVERFSTSMWSALQCSASGGSGLGLLSPHQANFSTWSAESKWRWRS